MALYNRSNVDPWNNLKEVLLKIGKINQKIAPVEPGFAVCALCCFLVRRR
jgi:hypothetical protein